VLNFDLAIPRSYHTQTHLPDNRILFAGGDVGASGQSTGDPTATAEIFDPALGTVESLPDMNRPRSRHTATSLSDGRVLVTGGADWQIFDVATEQWSEEVSTEFDRTSHAAALIADFGGAAGQDRVLIVGGDGQTAATLELLDPEADESVTLTSTLPIGLSRLAAAALPDGLVLVIGGIDQASGDTVADVFLVDPVGDSVTPIDDIPNRAGGIADHRLVTIEDRFVFVVGGEQIVSGEREILRYYAVFDSQTNQWVDNGETRNPHDEFVMHLLYNVELFIWVLVRS
jgi:N-acetylneuraminic acid mutarotase